MTTATNGEASDQFAPLVSLLKDLSLLGDSTTTGSKVLEDDASTFTKGITTLIAAGGGVATLGAATATFWNNINTPVRVTLIGGLAVVLAATLWAVAYLVVGDLRQRSADQIAVYQAREAIAKQYMSTTGTTPTETSQTSAPAPASAPTLDATAVALIALAAAHRTATVAIDGGGTGTLHGLRHANEKLQIAVRSGNQVSWHGPEELRLDESTYPAQ